MKSNYKRLGDYIRQVDVRNRDLNVTELVGLTIDKAFIPSVANTVGTDLSNYKVISHNQFACSLMQVSRDGKMPVAIYKGETAIMSPAYSMFEVSRTDELLPDFLMMWFSRKEFDREVTFWAVGGVRGSLTWEDFMNLYIPVPPIEEQQKIVTEYQAIERRVENNRRLISTLEASAQAIYLNMFVDNIDPNNLPDGWRMGKMKNIAKFAYGKMPTDKNCGDVPVFSGYGIVGYCDTPMYEEQHIIVIARGDSGSGKIVRSPKRFFLTNLAISINLIDEYFRDYIYYHLLSLDTTTLRTGSAQAQVTINSIEEFDILIPQKNKCLEFYNIVSKFVECKDSIIKEEHLLRELLSLLLSKLSNI